MIKLKYVHIYFNVCYTYVYTLKISYFLELFITIGLKLSIISFEI